MPPASTIRNVQALRFFAAFAVMAFHAGSQYQAVGAEGWLRPVIAPFATHGMLGVDLFFVVSGLVIWRTTAGRRGPADALEFLARRLSRVYLGYWPWLAIAAIGMRCVLDADLSGFGLWSSLFIIPLGDPRLLIVAWTLAVEVACYGLFALLMLLARPAALAALLLAGGGTVAIWVVLEPDMAGSGGLWLAPYLAEFAAGAALAAAIGRFGPPRVSWCAGALVAALPLALSLDGSRIIADRVLSAGPFAVATVALAITLEARGKVAGPGLVLLGDASYALYLCHVPLMVLAMALFWDQVPRHPDAMFLAMMATAILVSVGWYLAIERAVTAATRRSIASAMVPSRRPCQA